MAQFEVFSKDLLQQHAPLTVTLLKRGIISLSRSSYVAMSQPEAVELLYDRGSQTIGVAPVVANSDHSCFVRQTPSAFLIGAVAFLTHYGLMREASYRWPAYLERGVLCVDLSEPGTWVTSNRARRPDRNEQNTQSAENQPMSNAGE
jgi:hypothetical protein